MPEPLIVFEQVTLRSREGRKVFEGLDWSCPAGSRFRIEAERGAGASALLRLVAGLAHPVEGRVLLDGEPHHPHQFSHPYLRRGAVGWVTDDGGLVSNLTLLQNVTLPLRFLRGQGQDEAERLGLGMLERLGLGAHAAFRPHALVRGERKIAALGRSALAGAELWLLDHPLDDLDGRNLALATALLREILREPAVSVLAVGDGAAYGEFFPEVLRLERGRLSVEVQA